MKRLIVTDNSGQIIATGPHPDDEPEVQVRFGFEALDGQQVYEVELPEYVTTVEHLQELHQTHGVHVEGKTAKLVRKVLTLHNPGHRPVILLGWQADCCPGQRGQVLEPAVATQWPTRSLSSSATSFNWRRSSRPKSLTS